MIGLVTGKVLEVGVDTYTRRFGGKLDHDDHDYQLVSTIVAREPV